MNGSFAVFCEICIAVILPVNQQLCMIGTFRVNYTKKYGWNITGKQPNVMDGDLHVNSRMSIAEFSINSRMFMVRTLHVNSRMSIVLTLPEYSLKTMCGILLENYQLGIDWKFTLDTCDISQYTAKVPFIHILNI